ncbi:hypothetical protein GCM10023193_45490 [Planotetraspora kaengkrachanensis]|uniref:Superoxide dismutase n=1 Tax=Planotetraspora kaengkrachanensis TaxID=575193 RepID=A0A8J3VBS3_9ACTN|nr:hypothetical protein Pka01_73790 [Planotetraspora kaengkrachanensis]
MLCGSLGDHQADLGHLRRSLHPNHSHALRSTEHVQPGVRNDLRPDYVEQLWSLINWNDIIARFDAARGAA